MRRYLAFFLVVLLLASIISVGSADRINSYYNQMIPIYNVATGVFTQESFRAITSFMSYNVSSTIMSIGDTNYRVYTSATYIENDVSFGPIGDFAAVNQEGLTATYSSTEYKLRVQATPYYVSYTHRTQGSRDTSGNLYFGGSAEKSGTSSGTKTYIKQVIR